MDHRHDIKREVTDQVRPGDSVSQTSVKSNRTSLSSSIASAKLREQQRQVELGMKAGGLQQNKNIEEAKLQLRLQEEELHIKEELAISNAKSKIIQSFEVQQPRAPTSVLRDPSTSKYTDPVIQQPKHVYLNQTIREFVPSSFSRSVPTHQSSATSDDGSRTSSDDVMVSVVRQLMKPMSDIHKFGGNPLDYKKFMRQFRSKVVMNCEDDEERLNFLEQFTVGEPNTIVSGLSYMDAPQGYAAALSV